MISVINWPRSVERLTMRDVGCQGDIAQLQQLNGQQEPVHLLVADSDVAGDHVDGHNDVDDEAARGTHPAVD